ncbi:hypothetical protein PG985_009648 [Apiospora marii]|uniref:uncharacterized protein n=1 Tax=Apiospora marii TaxID=335849 RepID=UPI00312E5CAC
MESRTELHGLVNAEEATPQMSSGQVVSTTTPLFPPLLGEHEVQETLCARASERANTNQSNPENTRTSDTTGNPSGSGVDAALDQALAARPRNSGKGVNNNGTSSATAIRTQALARTRTHSHKQQATIAFLIVIVTPLILPHQHLFRGTSLGTSSTLRNGRSRTTYRSHATNG